LRVFPLLAAVPPGAEPKLQPPKRPPKRILPCPSKLRHTALDSPRSLSYDGGNENKINPANTSGTLAAQQFVPSASPAMLCLPTRPVSLPLPSPNHLKQAARYERGKVGWRTIGQDSPGPKGNGAARTQKSARMLGGRSRDCLHAPGCCTHHVRDYTALLRAS
jgi:hypothetical protein